MPIATDITIRLDINNIKSLRQVSRQVIRVVHERDHHTCRCCGFCSAKYQQILNPGGNWRDLDTLTTACIFCQQCFSLDAVREMRSGVLITLPDTEQTELNRLAVELYVARHSGTETSVHQANRCLDFLMETRKTTADRLGTDEPKELARMLRDSREDHAATKRIDKALIGLRLFPLDRRIMREADLEFNEFPQILEFWRSKGGPYPRSTSGGFSILERFAESYL